MRFEWDHHKDRRNVTKHKIDFETAKLVFDDPDALTISDRTVEGEERWRTLGMIEDVVVLVVHTYRDRGGEEVMRLISARKATASERKRYAEG